MALLLYCAMGAPRGMAADDGRLADVRREIHETLQALEQDGGKLDSARAVAQSLEREIAAAAERQAALEQRIARKAARVAELGQAEGELTEHHARVSAALHRQTLARYALLMQPRLKLLLNQSDSQRLGRNLAYFDYLAAAYRHDVNAAQSEAATLEQTASALKLETDDLRRLRHETAAHLELLRDTQSRHATLIAAIEGRVDARTERVRALREDEQRLASLIETLVAQPADPQRGVSFAALEGKLAWPAAGRVANVAGGAIREGGARWAGVLIETADGAEVRAVAGGRVVFADWFRNLGQLVILDHGEGYMTLYGNNAELRHQAGDEVAAGDIIARVGESSGELPRGLYFELRASGAPLDPRRWCKAR